jgi:hypothetical protein
MSAMVSGSESASDVSCGSFSEVGARNRHVRFPPDSDKTADIAGGPVRARIDIGSATSSRTNELHPLWAPSQ